MNLLQNHTKCTNWSLFIQFLHHNPIQIAPREISEHLGELLQQLHPHIFHLLLNYVVRLLLQAAHHYFHFVHLSSVFPKYIQILLIYLSLWIIVSFQHLCSNFIYVLLQFDYYSLLSFYLSSVLCVWFIRIVLEFSKLIFEGINLWTQFFPYWLIVPTFRIETIDFSFIVLFNFDIISLSLCLQLFFKGLIFDSKHFILAFKAGDLLLKLFGGDGGLVVFLLLLCVVAIIEPLVIALNEVRNTQK